MTNPIKRVFSTEGSFEDIEMTSKEASEFAKWAQAKIVEAEAKAVELTARATQKAALLERLGITEDEARLLLS